MLEPPKFTYLEPSEPLVNHHINMIPNILSSENNSSNQPIYDYSIKAIQKNIKPTKFNVNYAIYS